MTGYFLYRLINKDRNDKKGLFFSWINNLKSKKTIIDIDEDMSNSTIKQLGASEYSVEDEE